MNEASDSKNTTETRVRITYLPSGIVVEAPEGTDLLTAARENGVPIATQCLGEARCASCMVEVIEGEENLNRIKPDERHSITRKSYRLACRARAYGAVTVRCVHDPSVTKKDPGLGEDSHFDVGGSDFFDR
ncbi:MAG: 2Fe-2S iron-sulfur cluster binding domain-containing protein [Gemmatimonadetes bacterium]|nr:2Fe-2S iron-sulfur cluster binding domain-containing protein [Gemmatimonadota bacterium]